MLEGIPALGLANATEADARSAIAELDELDLLETQVEASFRRVCLPLEPGGEQAYTHYRLQCQLTDPSDCLIDHYIVPTEAEPGIALRTAPEQLNTTGWSALLLASKEVPSLVAVGQRLSPLDFLRTFAD